MATRNPREEGRRSELLVLFCLMSRPMSGYGIRKLMRLWHMGTCLRLTPTTVYRALERLRKMGCLTATRERNSRFPISTVFEMTDAGRERYRQLIYESARFRRTPHALGEFLGLATRLPPAERRTLAEEWRKAAQAAIREIDGLIRDKTPGRTYGKPFAEWLMLDHERALLRAEIAWLKKYVRWSKAGAA